MTVPQKVNPPGAAFPAMSQAIRMGDRVLVSGQVALRDGQVTGLGDAEAQARQCFANIEASLKAAGATLDQVVRLRCYLTSADAYPGYAALRTELFTDIQPCSTTVIVQGLLLPGLLMEVEAEAFSPV